MEDVKIKYRRVFTDTNFVYYAVIKQQVATYKDRKCVSYALYSVHKLDHKVY